MITLPKPELEQRLLWDYAMLTSNSDSLKVAQLLSDGLPEEYVRALTMNTISPQNAVQGFLETFLQVASDAYNEQLKPPLSKKLSPFNFGAKKVNPPSGSGVPMPATTLMNKFMAYDRELRSQKFLLHLLSPEEIKRERLVTEKKGAKYYNSDKTTSYLLNKYDLAPLVLPKGNYYFGNNRKKMLTRFVNRVLIAFSLDGTIVTDNDKPGTLSRICWEESVMGVRYFLNYVGGEKASSPQILHVNNS
jgi:hypothetical protein